MKRKIRHFHVDFVYRWERNVLKKCAALTKLLFCILDLLPFDVVVSFAVVRSYSSRKRLRSSQLRY